MLAKKPSTKSAITVIGAGAWGTALAVHLASLGQTVYLYGRGDDAMAELAQSRCNDYFLPGVKFPESLQVCGDWESLQLNTEDLLLAVPSHVFRLVLSGVKSQFTAQTKLLWATKGLDPRTHQLLSDVVEEECGPTQAAAVLSGPSFAKEVGRQQPTAVVVASNDESIAQHFATRFSGPCFRVYTSTDSVGVQLGGALKNVMAIAVGISDGLGYGANARSALITRGLAEITRLGMTLGAEQKTFMGLAGTGDLVLTCTDDQSRNRRMGLALGAGKSIAQAQQEIGQVVEGVTTAELMMALAEKHGVDLPITRVVFELLNNQLTAEEAVLQLFSRDPKAE